jgi:mannose-1-phosphate guanylyltransferase
MKIIILAGGGGMRLWPLSKQSKPKQFQNILGERSMLQESVTRLTSEFNLSDVYVATNEAYADEARSELPDLPDGHVLVEPEKRDTAGGLGFAGWQVDTESEEEVLAFLPADHYIADAEEFRRGLRSGEQYLQEHPESIVTLGIQPTAPETGYGYIAYETERSGQYGSHDIHAVTEFKEKPDVETAREYLVAGNYVWNAGMFLMTKSHLKELYRTILPDMADTFEQLQEETEEARIAEVYGQIEKMSFDHGILERIEQIAVLPISMGWSDIGSWRAVKDLYEEDNSTVLGTSRHLDIESDGVLIHGQTDRMISTIGVKNIAIVDTEDALLVADMDRTQEVKKLVEQLEEEESGVV